MAKLKQLPHMDIINGFRGVIDFYLCCGIPCARAWPRSPAGPRSPGVQATWPAFTWAAQNWKNLSPAIKDAYNQMAVGTQKTGKDIFTMSYINGDYLYLEGV